VNVGIVGHESAKFTSETEARAREIIRSLFTPDDTVVSGHCPLGGIDIWAEEEALNAGAGLLIFPPKVQRWHDGYMPRNLQIAAHSDVVHCIVVAAYPPGYEGMRFDACYHCKTVSHIKSGGCWTALRCRRRQWHIIR
jgi:predicted Rossmann fold nucleotide-binding protein DprA/Smf involved in DNA uptake